MQLDEPAFSRTLREQKANHLSRFLYEWAAVDAEVK